MDKILVEFEIAQAQLRKEIEEVRGELKKVEKQAKTTADNTNKSLGSVVPTLKNIAQAAGVAFSIGAVIQFGKKVIETTATFERLEAVLVNTLGSNSKAQKALEMIKDFAAKTPFSVEQLTGSFVKLANQGFIPTIAQMKKLGDLASSTGKDFDMLAEAIIDAQVGEFERLKEFGIRAEKQGDKVMFTFKGVKTEVDFAADAIQNYVVGLGDVVGVSGSMEAISKTMGGAISNLGDSFTNLLSKIGDTWVGGTVKFALKGLTDLFSDLGNAISGVDESVSNTDISKMKDLQEGIAGADLPKKTADLEKFIEAQKKELALQTAKRKAQRESGDVNSIESGQTFARVKGLQDLIAKAKATIEQNKIEAKQESDKIANDPKRIAAIKKETEARQKNIESILDTVQKTQKLLASYSFESDASKQAQKDLKGFNDEIEKTQTLFANAPNLPNLPVPVPDWESLTPPSQGEILQAWVTDNIDAINEVLQGMSNVAVAIGDAFSDMYTQQAQDAQHSQDEQLKALEKRNTEGALSDRAYAKEKERIEKEGAKKQFELRYKQAKLDKELAIFNIGLKIAETIANYTAGVVTAAALPFALAAEGVALAAAIAKPLPKYHTGKKADLSKHGEHQALILDSEHVIAPDKSREFNRELLSIHKGRQDFEKLILETRIKPAIKRDRESLLQSGSFAQNIANAINLDTYSLERTIRKNGTVKLDDSTIAALASKLSIQKNVRNGS